MGRKLLRLSALVLIFTVIMTNFTLVASAEKGSSSYTITVEDIINPLYEDAEYPTIAVRSVTPKRYYSSAAFNPDIYTDNETSVISDIRSTMVNRGDTLTVYFKDDVLHDNTTFGNLIDDWIEEVYAETDNSNEGDYLQYSYRRIDFDNVNVHLETSDYYYTIPITFSYYTTKAQEDELTTEIEEIIDEFNFTNFTTARQKSDTIYEYITDNVTYDYDNLNDSDYTLKYSAYAALINGTAVCQGYATLFYRLARECGLEARVIAGTSQNQNHAWNIVKIGTSYYYLDSTWDAGLTSYRYYLKGSGDFADHTPEERFSTAEFTEKYPISIENFTETAIESLYEYSIYGNKAYITKYKGNEKDVIIPTKLGGYPVEALGYHAIDSNDEYPDDKIETITFPEGMASMELEAIYGCHNLKEINFPSTFHIDYEKYEDASKSGYTTAPIYCENIENITVAEGNPYMKVIDGIIYSADGEGVIYCPPRLPAKKVTIPDGVVTIAPRAFDDCDNIEEIAMPDTVKYIGYWAFCSTAKLKTVNISEACEVIGQFVFLDNTLIDTLHIPASVVDITSGAFGQCNLKAITVDENNPIYYIENNALIEKNTENGDMLIDYITGSDATEFTVPESVTAIYHYAFEYAANLKKITVPETVTYIDSYAFKDCTGLTHFEFPSSVSKVPYYAFLGCDNLASIIIPSTVTQIGDDSDDLKRIISVGNTGCTIYGEDNSVAKSYAATYSIKFKLISNFNNECHNGHDMEKAYIDQFNYHYVCKTCGDSATKYTLTNIGNITHLAVLEHENYYYTPGEIKPVIKSFQFDDGAKLVEGVDYEIVCYVNNGGASYIEIKGIGNYAGTGYIPFNILPVDGSNLPIKLSYTFIPLVQASETPDVTIEGLEEDIDYSYYCDNYWNLGTATVNVTYCGNYYGNGTAYYEVGVAAPTELTASLYGQDDVKLNWTAVEYAQGYNIYYKKHSADDYKFFADVTDTTCNVPNLGTDFYDFKVVAYYKNGDEKKLSELFQTASISTIDNLAAPSKVTLSLYGHNDVSISWSEVECAEGYNVYYKSSSAKAYTLLTSTTATSYKKANLSSNTTYTFKVVPINYWGEAVLLSDNYKTASITTLRNLPSPEKVTLSLYGHDDISVSWSKVDYAKGYYLYYKSSSAKSYTLLTTTAATSYKKADLLDGVKYYFKVVPYGTFGTKALLSDNYRTSYITTLRNAAAPNKVTLSLYGHDDVSVSWSKMAYAAGYYVYYKSSSAKSYTYAGKTTGTSFKKANLSDGVKYYFKVVPYSSYGSKVFLSPNYKTAYITTLRNAAAPSRVTLSLYGYDDVTVSWSKVAYAKGYYVYYKTSSAKSYTYAGKTTGTSFKKANLSDGVKYYFKVVPYSSYGSKVFLSPNYKTAYIYTLKKISTPTVKRYSSGKVTVGWTNISGESGYQISKSASKTGTAIVSTYTTTSGKSKTLSATRKKTYYYKVRAFKTVGGKRIYGPWSAVKAYKLK